jgi:hypothetical protein
MAQNHKLFVKYVRKCIKKVDFLFIFLWFCIILDMYVYDCTEDGTVEEG